MKSSGWAKSLPYLEQQGHLNYEQSKVILGDIEKASVVSADWAEERFGIRPIGNAVYLKGRMYAPKAEMPDDQAQALKMK